MKRTKRQTAIITGASGFIGYHLTKELQARDIQTIPLPHERLYDLPSVVSFFTKHSPDYIFLLHSYGNHSHQDSEDATIMANYFATWNVLKASSFSQYKALIHISSSSVLLPYETFYSASKAGAERLCKAYATNYKKPIAIVRPYSVYGPGEADFRFIPTVFRSCLTGKSMALSPNASHDWIYVDDFIKRMLLIVDAIYGVKGETFNIGTGISTTNEEVIAMIEKITSSKAIINERRKLRAFDTTEWVDKDAQASAILPTTKLEAGLRKCYAYYRRHDEQTNKNN